MNKVKTYCWLFSINLFISAFTFGGGYVVIPMIKKYYVEEKQLFDEEELMDIAAIAQSSPGAIAINMSALAGYRVAGWQGLLISCIAAILPPLVILSVVSAVYSLIRDNRIISAVLKGMEAGVAALIVDLIIDMYALIIKEKQLFYTCMVPAAFILNYIFHVNVAIIIIGTLFVCIFKYQFFKVRA
ncbi:chromate transporter [Dielma fastidiosa]|uniref:Chromate transporter n=1 Tax=Dielma fastidiosa TaxID=1034346 RepID=A0AB35URY0_9FIRM|nr:chromate transporter [Dielma fastidiosa]MDY5169726.1 chromate transporter [Dielma fastidiosa]